MKPTNLPYQVHLHTVKGAQLMATFFHLPEAISYANHYAKLSLGLGEYRVYNEHGVAQHKAKLGG